MVLVRGLAAVAAVALMAAAANGCSGGLSADDANTRCMIEQSGKSACFSADVFSACVSCYTRCGNDCVPQELCPEQYLCPGDKLAGTGGSGAGGSGTGGG